MRGYKKFVAECTIEYSKPNYDSPGTLEIHHPDVGGYRREVEYFADVTDIARSQTKWMYRMYKMNIKQKGLHT